jgi:hypothetical protein
MKSTRNILDVAGRVPYSTGSPDVDSGRSFFKNLPRSIQDRSDSPEVLLSHFRDQICPMLSITGSQENMWKSLVLPLVHNSQSLCLAISALTALHISTNNTSSIQLHAHGAGLLLQSFRSLQSELNRTERMIGTLATIILLASWTGWSEGLHHAKTHMNGASALLSQIGSRYMQQTWRFSSNEKCALMFLVSTFVHIAALSSLVHAAIAKGNIRFLTDSMVADGMGGFQMRHGFLGTTHPLISLDPWLDCLSTSIYLMKQAALVCHDVVSGTSTSSAICQRATRLKQEIEGWTPTIRRPRSRAQLFTADEEYMLHTAEAYRYATLLYLHQAVPEMLSASSQQLATTAIAHLCSCPPSATITFAQTYPLFVAGCEVTSKEDRQWVKERWTTKMMCMRVPNISKCWEITQEVWKRRDAYKQMRRESSVSHQRCAASQCPVEAEDMDVEFTVKGSLHWAQIMKERDWEVSF